MLIFKQNVFLILKNQSVCVCVFTGQVKLGHGVSSDNVQGVKQRQVDSKHGDSQQGDTQHLEQT